MKSGIYKLEWENGHFYYGQSQDLLKRKIGHFSRMKNGTHSNSIMNRLYRLCGFPEFIIVELCPIHLLNEREQSYLDIFFENRWCCNIEPTAGSSRGVRRSQETKNKISKIRKNKPLSEDHKKSISIAGFRRAEKGYVQPKRFGKDNHYFGKTHSDDIRKKMRKSKNVGENNSKAKLVINLENGVFYGTIKEAAESISKNALYLYKMLNKNNENKTSFRII